MKKIQRSIFLCGIFLLSSLLVPTLVYSKSSKSKPAIQWSKTYSGSQEEAHAHCIIEMSDGGFVQIGETGFIEDLTARILIVKTDSNGDLSWKKEFGSPGYNLGNSIVEGPDASLIAVGSLNKDAFIIKLDATSGKTIWKKIWNPGTEDAFEAVAISETGGIIATGYKNGIAENTFYNEGEGYLIKTDKDGNEVFVRDINTVLSTGYRIKTLSDGYLIMGMPLLEGKPQYKIVKFKFDGEFVWGKGFLGDTLFWGFDVDDKGNIFLSGHDTNGPLSKNYDVVTAKLTATGEEIWRRWSGQPRGYNAKFIHDETWGLRQTNDGGCLVVAGSGDEYSYSASGHSTGSSDRWVIYLIKYDAKGGKEWQLVRSGLDVWGEDGDWAGEDVVITAEGDIVVAVDNGGFGFVKFKKP